MRGTGGYPFPESGHDTKGITAACQSRAFPRPALFFAAPKAMAPGGKYPLPAGLIHGKRAGGIGSALVRRKRSRAEPCGSVRAFSDRCGKSSRQTAREAIHTSSSCRGRCQKKHKEGRAEILPGLFEMIGFVSDYSCASCADFSCLRTRNASRTRACSLSGRA